MADKTDCSGFGKVILACPGDSKGFVHKADKNVVFGDLGTEYCVSCLGSWIVNQVLVVDDLKK